MRGNSSIGRASRCQREGCGFEPRFPLHEIKVYYRMKKIIHVNQHKIRANTKNGTDEPVLTVKTYKENTYAHEAYIKTKCGEVVAKIIYSPHKPLSCGARVWIETDTDDVDVVLIDRNE